MIPASTPHLWHNDTEESNVGSECGRSDSYVALDSRQRQSGCLDPSYKKLRKGIDTDTGQKKKERFIKQGPTEVVTKEGSAEQNCEAHTCKYAQNCQPQNDFVGCVLADAHRPLLSKNIRHVERFSGTTYVASRIGPDKRRYRNVGIGQKATYIPLTTYRDLEFSLHCGGRGRKRKLALELLED